MASVILPPGVAQRSVVFDNSGRWSWNEGMDGYDQLWSLIEAAETDGFPTLADDLLSASRIASATTVDAFVYNVGVDLSSGTGDELFNAGFLTAAAGDAFFPIDDVAGIDASARFAVANDFLPGIDPFGGDQPLVLPMADGGSKDIIEPLVLPGVMDDDFFIAKDGDGRLVLPGVGDDFGVPDVGGHLLDRLGARGVFEMPVDHTLYVDDHGLIGAHTSDDWLF
jgi:hypothetical protein